MNTFKRYMQIVFAVLWKDLSIEWRSHELVPGMTLFGVLVIVIFNFAFELDLNLQNILSVGIIWVTLLFAGTLGLNRIMAAEKDRGTWDGLLLAPVDRSAIYFGKMLSIFLSMLLMAAIILPVFSVLYSVNLLNAGFIVVVMMGTLGYAAIGTLLSGIAMQTRLREAILPALMLPVCIPLVLAALRASTAFLQGGELQPWMALLWVFDVVFLVIGWMVFETIVEE